MKEPLIVPLGGYCFAFGLPPESREDFEYVDCERFFSGLTTFQAKRVWKFIYGISKV